MWATSYRDFLDIILFVLLTVSVFRRLNTDGSDVSVTRSNTSSKLLRFIASVEMNLDSRGAELSPDGMAVGILISPESGVSDIFRSLDSILDNGYPPSRDVRFFVQVSSIDNLNASLATARLLEQKYRKLIGIRKLDVFVPHPALYAFESEFDHLQGHDYGGAGCTRLRTLELLHLMLRSHLNARYYLQLTAGVVAKKRYFAELEEIISNHAHVDWLEIKLSGVPLAAALYQTEGIRPFVDFAIHHLTPSRCSGLMDRYLDALYEGCVSEAKNTRRCTEKLENGQITSTPSVFLPQTMSTNDDKELVLENYSATQKRNASYAFDATIPIRYEYWPYEEIPIYINPPALIATVGLTGDSCGVASLYRFRCKFSRLRATPATVITFAFHPPVRLSEFYLRSGHDDCPRSTFPSSTFVRVTPTPSSQNKSLVVHFDRRGIAEGPVGDRYGKIHKLQIHFTESSDNWLVLRDIVVKVGVVSDDEASCCEDLWHDPFPSGIPGYDS